MIDPGDPLHADLGKLLLSFTLGMVVGLEREISDKPAGLRTNVLICLGSTLFTLVSAKMSGPMTDPTRIAAQVVSGIGFLGAGAIMREGEHVTGLTTAATIFVVAAIGMAVGFGFSSLAAVCTIATLIVQVVLARMDMLVDYLRRRYTFRIVSSPDEKAIEAIEKILRVNGVRVMYHKVMKKESMYHSEWATTGPTRKQAKVAQELLKSEKVMEVTY
ncbi:MAG: MgtC/SapB family protein [Elusimicrobia bacterium]|nr:MgtC/SapB family protein [Elusimicrobiota bacterium]